MTGRALPVGFCDYLVGIQAGFGQRGRSRSGMAGVGGARRSGRGGRRGGCVGLEDVEALEFLVEDGERLEALCLFHLVLEPVLDLVLLDVLQVLVVVVEVPVELQQGEHLVVADGTDQARAGGGGGGADCRGGDIEGDSRGNVVCFGAGGRSVRAERDGALGGRELVWPLWNDCRRQRLAAAQHAAASQCPSRCHVEVPARGRQRQIQRCLLLHVLRP